MPMRSGGPGREASAALLDRRPYYFKTVRTMSADVRGPGSTASCLRSGCCCCWLGGLKAASEIWQHARLAACRGAIRLAACAGRDDCRREHGGRTCSVSPCLAGRILKDNG